MKSASCNFWAVNGLKIHLIPFFMAVFIFLSGCGYQLGEIRPTPMRSVKTLAVSTFKNRTFKPRVEVLAANALIKRLQQDGTFKIVDDVSADALLECTINNIERRAVRSSVTDVLISTEFEIRVMASYTVTDRVSGRTLMQGNKLGTTTFFSTPDIVAGELQALPAAFADLAVEIATEISEGW